MVKVQKCWTIFNKFEVSGFCELNITYMKKRMIKVCGTSTFTSLKILLVFQLDLGLSHELAVDESLH